MQLPGQVQGRPPRCGALTTPPPSAAPLTRLCQYLKVPGENPLPGKLCPKLGESLLFYPPYLFILATTPLLRQLREEAINTDKAKKRQTKAPAFWAGRAEWGDFQARMWQQRWNVESVD